MIVEPELSVIIPAYNRAGFLKRAISSINVQDVSSTEILIVDDGSVDDTKQACLLLSEKYHNIKYIYQDNQGPGAARATGLKYARGQYIAFFDSDDYWLENHIFSQLSVLKNNPDLDAVYSNACRIELSSNRVLDKSVFTSNGKKRDFLSLKTRPGSGGVNIISDRNTEVLHIKSGIFAGFQTTLFRKKIFNQIKIPPIRIGEDKFFFLSFLLSHYTIGYLMEPTVQIFEHPENTSSTTSVSHPIEKLVQNSEIFVKAHLDYKHHNLTMRHKIALRKKAANDLFWILGYNFYLKSGRKKDAIGSYARAIRIWPWKLSFWKTFLLSMLK